MLSLPALQGTIRRRLLINFRADPAVVQRQLPKGFRPKLQGEHAIVGICLIRLENIRPKHSPLCVGLASENGAHRFAVRWTDGDGEREGVYIPRRDTGSLLNHLAGGRVFPGEHHLASFDVEDDGAAVCVAMRAKDGLAVEVRARAVDALPAGSVFANLADASRFFELGSVGYSVTNEPNRLDGIELRTDAWRVGALDVETARSSYFEDETRFPRGSLTFDCGLVMRDVEHEWGAEPPYVAA